MAKIAFSARKNPLLGTLSPPAADAIAEPHPAPAGRAAGTTVAADAPPAAKRRAADTRGPDLESRRAEHIKSGARPNGRAVEGPAGVVAVEAGEPVERNQTPRPPSTVTPATSIDSAPADSGTAGARGRASARRVQTSISLPPAVWDSLDELAEQSATATGALLTALLTTATPESSEAAFAAVEQLLTTTGDEGRREERNFRLPWELRSQLDTIVKTLGPRVPRSLLVRAIVAGSIPENPDQARELVTSQRLRAIRTAMRMSATA